MLALARKLAALAVAVAAVALLSGCVGISSTSTSQPQSMGPVNLGFSACVPQSPGCTSTSNSGTPYPIINDGESFGYQLLIGVRLPDGVVPPQSLSATLAGGAKLAFSRSASYEAQLQTWEPAPAGERWWGWLSAQTSYSKAAPQSYSVSLQVNAPQTGDGSPYPSPMHWRPVVGARQAEGTLTATRPVVCGSSNEELYEGFNELAPSVTPSIVCVDSPDPAATRGFLGAPIIDFGIIGTAVTASAGSTVTATFLARRSGSPDPGTSFDLAASSAVPGGSVTIDRTSVSLAGDSTNPVLATVTVPPGTPPGSYPVTLTATAPGKPSRTGTTTVTVPAAPPGPTAATAAPELTAGLTRKRFRAGTLKGEAAKGLPPVGTRLKLDVSRAATLSIAVEKKKTNKGFKPVKTVSRSIPAGKSTIAIKSKVLSVKLTPGRYRLKLTASADGQKSPTRSVAFTFVAG